MENKTKSVKPNTPKGDIQVSFGNVESLKLQLLNEQNKLLRQGVSLLSKIESTLIRIEGKYDANQEKS